MNQSHNINHSIQECVLMYKRLYGKELDFYDLLENAPIVLRATGSIARKAFLFQGDIEKHSDNKYCLDLPCNVYAIKSVTDSKPLNWYGLSYNQMQNVLLNYRIDESRNLGEFNPDATQVNDLGPDVLYEVPQNVVGRPWGVMLDFENIENKCLEFNKPCGRVDVIYVGGIFDEDGYPKVPEKTIVALCAYQHYIDIRIKFFGKQADINMLTVAEKDKDKAIAQARTPSFLSANEMDMMLNVFTDSNKKQHNVRMRG